MPELKQAPERGDLAPSMLASAGTPRPVWEISDQPVDYKHAIARMEKIADGIRQNTQPERVWLVEHPPLYSAGTSATPDDLVSANRFPVHETGRGGEYTYHGPGQRVCYAMLDLNRRTPDVRAYVSSLEAWIINTLAHFNVQGERREDRVGVWVKRPDKAPLPDGTPREDKIAAIGIRVRRWVTFPRHFNQCGT